jgi:hypothetical protein
MEPIDNTSYPTSAASMLGEFKFTVLTILQCIHKLQIRTTCRKGEKRRTSEFLKKAINSILLVQGEGKLQGSQP